MLKKQRLTATLSCPVWNQRTVQRSRCPIGPNKLHHVTSKTNPVLLISCRMVCWIYRNAMWPLTSEQWRHVISLRLKATHCGPKPPEKTQTRDKGTVRRSDRETTWRWDKVTSERLLGVLIRFVLDTEGPSLIFWVDGGKRGSGGVRLDAETNLSGSLSRVCTQ